MSLKKKSLRSLARKASNQNLKSKSYKKYPLMTVGGLIQAPDGEVLIVKSHKWQDQWTFPGGKVELGESLVEAFHREILEETGLTIVSERYLTVIEFIHPKEFYLPGSHFVTHEYLGQIKSNAEKESVLLNDEAETFQWILPEKASEFLSEAGRELIEMAFGGTFESATR